MQVFVFETELIARNSPIITTQQGSRRITGCETETENEETTGCCYQGKQGCLSYQDDKGNFRIEVR
jgi:hypothetical protein